jgi:hypothetical protein
MYYFCIFSKSVGKRAANLSGLEQRYLTVRFGLYRLESIRGLSFFFKKTQFEVQVFSVKKLEPRIEYFQI